ncbi:arfaptin-2-like isoform X4 [Chiloscyllium punctatum]|uniref:arfaptin-2-like isoform X4 n=1 Tax=Chiloscyllium punctatum TaxID=137246 RepID=UPI003B63C15A
MTDGIMGKAATMEIAINSNGDTAGLPEDDGLEQDLQQVMVSGPNLNETSIVSGGYGGTAEAIIATGTIKGTRVKALAPRSVLISPSRSAASRIASQGNTSPGCSNLHQSQSGPMTGSEESSRGIAGEKFDIVKKWGINTYKEEFGHNADTQKLLCKNGETLLGAINFFVSSINTLVNKTMEDTLLTVKLFENARLEYDAYRTDLEELNLGPRDSLTLSKIDLAQQLFLVHKEKYERLRSDVTIKLKFLEENKVKVMHKQLLLFHNAISAWNQQQLEQTLKQFNVKMKVSSSEKPSWLEEQ